ncbi:MAG: helix-turn-helix transcriptional regulator [Alphaproteobacteria bacterium]|nr:helix-turn-helix transcriptional regulator [Alphaproteobacteria bacterium]MDD9919340.1 helix-turn-helix transcriptional regulator [Alphaproteobacteria bacterium]
MNYLLDLPLHWNHHLAKKIRTYRKAHNLTQKQLADKMEILEQRLHQIETFSQPITVVELSNLMAIFELTYKQFFDDNL